MHPDGNSGNATLETENGTGSLALQDDNLKAAGRMWIDGKNRDKFSLISYLLMVG